LGEHIQIESPTMHLSDLKIFFKSLLEFIDEIENSNNFYNKISNCLDFITKQTTHIELNNASYDSQSIQRDILHIKSFFSNV
jgi:hypothetical protein